MFKKILSRLFGKKSDAKKTDEKKQNVIKPTVQPTVEEVNKTAPIVTVKAEQKKSEPVVIKEEKTVLQSENHQADFCAAVEKEPTEDISDKLYKRRYAPKKKEDEQEKVEADSIISAETPSVTVMKDEDDETPFDTSREVSSVTESENKSDEIYEMAEASKAEDDDMPFTVKKKENTEITEVFDDDIVIESVEQSEQLPLTVNEKNQNDVEKISADTPVNELKHLSVRAKESLLKSGMTVIGQITELSDEELRKLKAGYEIADFVKRISVCSDSETEKKSDIPFAAVELSDEKTEEMAESETAYKTESENDAAEPETTEPMPETEEPSADVKEEIQVENQKLSFSPQTPTQNLPLSVRSKNSLCRAGIMNLAQLMECSDDKLSKIRNLGAKSFQEIVDFKNNPERTGIKSEEPVPDNTEITEEVPFIKTDIWNLPLSVRSKNVLCKNGIMILEQLMNFNNDELKKFRNLGARSFQEIVDYKEEIADHLFDEELETTNVSGEKREICEQFLNDLNISMSHTDKIRPYCHRILMQCENEDELLRELYEEPHVNDVLKKKIFILLSENKVFGVRLPDIRAALPDNLPEDIFTEILNDAAQKDHGKRYILKSIKLIELLENDEQIGEDDIEIIKSRLSGKTLAEIAEKFELTRERIRQKQKKILGRIINKSVRMKKSLSENRFKPLFEKYSFDEEMFCTLTEQPPETFMFLKITAKTGEESVFEMFKELQLPGWILRNWEKYCRESANSGCLFIAEDNNRYVEKTRAGIEIYLMSKYCRDEMLFDDFIDLYQDFMKKHGLENDPKLRITEAEKRSQENQISRSMYALWKFGKKFRYYDISSNDYSNLLTELNLEQYQNTEISTLKLFRDYHELMDEYDIRDEYELHNLLKKIGYGKDNPDIQWNMPHICFGKFKREDMIKDYMLRLAPISAEKLAETISEDYGFKPDLIFNHFTCIDEYYKDGIFTVDFDAMTEEQLKLLSDNLPDDFYYITEIEKIFTEMFPDSSLTLVNSFNLKKIGFIIYSTYAVKNHKNATEYFEKLLTKNDVIDISGMSRRYSGIMQYNVVLAELKDDYTIIEFEPYQCINMRKLEKMGIDKSKLKNYCDEVYEITRSTTYFTVESLQKSGFSSSLDNLGFESWFYSSLLREDDRFTYKKIGGTVLFDTTCGKVSTQALILHIVSEYKSIEIDELAEYIKEKFCIILDKDNLKWRIKNTELYFDEIMQKIYDEYNTYYEEIMSIDDEE